MLVQASEASIRSKYASGAPAGGSVLFITLPKSNRLFTQMKRTSLSQFMGVTSFDSISRSSRFRLNGRRCTLFRA